MKRSPIKKRSKSDRAKAKERAMTAFKKYIRVRDSLATTKRPDGCLCVSCGQFCTGVTCHAGHFIHGSSSPTYFREDNVHGQCSACNVYDKDNAKLKYVWYMESKYGKERCEHILRVKHTCSKKMTIDQYNKITERYKKKLKELT